MAVLKLGINTLKGKTYQQTNRYKQFGGDQPDNK